MSEWSQLSGKFHGKDEVEALLEHGARGREAIGLWCWAKSVCTLHHETRGTIAAGKVRRAGWPTQVAALLVEVGLWAETDGGYVFTDWTEHAESPEEVESRREAARERQARSRESRRMSQRDSECDSQGESPAASHVSHVAEEIREEKKRGEEKSATTPARAYVREGEPTQPAAPPSPTLAELAKHPSLRLAASEPGFDREVELAAVQAGKTALVAKALTEAADEVTSRGWAGDGPAVRKVVLKFVRYARPEVAPPERPGGRRLMGATPQGGSIAHFARVSPEDLRASQPEGDIDF